MKKQIKISVIGMGYVGLPLALEFGSKYTTIGFDLNKIRIELLSKNLDSNNEISKMEFKKSKNIAFSNNIEDIKNSDYFIVCVPTPINNSKKPDLKNLKSASKIVGKVISPNNIVIYESTVYPGVTENICIPIIEKISKLNLIKIDKKIKNGFYCGYSPERINPGDKERKIKDIVKIVSGSNKFALNKIDKLYKSIIKAGTCRVDSIKIAEAAKVIENVQRDVNIALVNEFAKIFKKDQINTNKVIEAASSKWNFVKYFPGLVGGHCIGVDPFYLSFRAKQLGINPKMILAGRETNDKMYLHFYNLIISLVRLRKINLSKSNVLLMGYSFKENCTDTRNTQIKKLFNKFSLKSKKVEIFDPNIDHKLLNPKIRNSFISKPKNDYYDIVVIGVAHNIFKKLGSKRIVKYSKKKSVIFDLKNIFKNKFYSA